jgi:hypothetical protein
VDSVIFIVKSIDISVQLSYVVILLGVGVLCISGSRCYNTFVTNVSAIDLRK